jgi:cell division protein FtsB
MTDIQSYEQRVSRLADARRKDSAAKRTAVIKAVTELRREDRRVTRRAVIARAGVHRNFLHRHKDLGALIDDAAGGQRPNQHLRPEDRITQDSLLAELAAARQRNRELQQKVQALERRLGAQGPSFGPALLDQHPLVIELHSRIAQLELDIVDKNRTIASLQDDVDVLRETNRSLVREYGLTGG